MTELSWTPREIGALTIAQLLCLTHAKDPA